MKRSPHIQFLATAMASRSPYRGSRGGHGRGQGQRGFSDRPYNGERGQFVSGDSHLRSVRDENLGLRQGERGRSFTNRARFQPPPYNQNHQQYRQPPPYNQNQQFRPSHAFRQPPPFDPNQAARPQHQLQQFRPPWRPKPLDYRNWEFAKTAPPPNCERFVVLSYNILADYLAISHRHKLYFHIPRYMMDWEWRKRSILFELGLWSADIMCFQEVDRFQDLEEELKRRGYSGIWKMRTGMPVDGCAIFWRTSRFKLLHEECIEFNKLGLRDNVAQICVLELLNQNNAENTATLQTSSAGSNKVVICNIHVLYNPKRGEIKLGQVRMLLDRAHSVSKIWNNAPVVLCGDFNCTPKSPLYNFISEQKLDLSGLDRDKLSGQASAEIHAPRPYNPEPGFQSADSSVLAPSLVDGREVGGKLNDSLSDTQKQNNPDSNVENLPFMNLSQPQCATTVLDICNKSDINMQFGNDDSALYDEVTRETKQTLEDVSKGETRLVLIDTLDSSKESSSTFCNEDGFPVDQINDEIHKFTTPVASHVGDNYSNSTRTEHGENANTTSHSNQVSLSEHSHFHIYTENESRNCDNSSLSLEVSPPGGSGYLSSQSIASDKKGSPSAPYEVNVSSESTSIDLDKKLQSLSLNEVDKATAEAATVDEDDSAFLSALHGTEDAFPADFGQVMRSDLDHSPKEFAFDPHNPLLHSPSHEVVDDFSPGLDSEAVDVEKSTYDPSLWTPMEIATATGNEDCTILEHPLKLKSTYTEVEDCSGTRDSSEEPLVTSYNRCFLGTVDYIWRSEGLQTVRVLAPIPKDGMQWTAGFPTKKWGSDHIALASELVFTKDLSNHNTEVR